MKNYIIALFLSLTMVCNAQPEWKEDIAFLKSELPKNHKNLFFQLEQKQFDKELDVLSSKIDEMKPIDIALSLQQIVVKAGDSHTGVGYRQLLDRNKRLPLNLYWFDDGIYVLSTTNKHEHLLGSRLEKVGAHSISEIIDSLGTLVVQDNSAFNKIYVPEFVNHPQILSFFGFIPNDSTSILFSFTDMNGKQVQDEFIVGEKTDKWIHVQTKETPLFWQNPKSLFWDKYSDDGIYYVQYNACFGKEVAVSAGNLEQAEKLPSFNDFTKNIFSTVNEKPIKRFVFDMRFNGGGSSAQGTEFVQQLKKNKKLNKKGVLYVIIGRKTFSSAIINTMNFKDETKAITVGEETGGMPNHYGEVRSFKLPNLGISIQYSTKYFQYTKENVNTITPDIKVKYNFRDYLNGIDPSMNEILNGL